MEHSKLANFFCRSEPIIEQRSMRMNVSAHFSINRLQRAVVETIEMAQILKSVIIKNNNAHKHVRKKLREPTKNKNLLL